jgi:hypothetical protein
MCYWGSIQWVDDCKRQALECRDLLLSVVNNSSNSDFAERIKDVKEDIEAGEWRLALEVICENVYEFEIAINQEIYVKLCEACKNFGIDISYTDNIKYLIKMENKNDT